MGKGWESDDQASNFWATHLWTKPRRIFVVWVALEALACTGDIQVLWFQQRSPKQEAAFISLNVIFCPMSTTTYPLQLQKTWRRAVLTLGFWLNWKLGLVLATLARIWKHTSHSTAHFTTSTAGGDLVVVFIYVYICLHPPEKAGMFLLLKPLTWNGNDKNPICKKKSCA